MFCDGDAGKSAVVNVVKCTDMPLASVVMYRASEKSPAAASGSLHIDDLDIEDEVAAGEGMICIDRDG
jgi:hypothetical protein